VQEAAAGVHDVGSWAGQCAYLVVAADRHDPPVPDRHGGGPPGGEHPRAHDDEVDGSGAHRQTLTIWCVIVKEA
jgi:hypothetical protein